MLYPYSLFAVMPVNRSCKTFPLRLKAFNRNVDFASILTVDTANQMSNDNNLASLVINSQ